MSAPEIPDATVEMFAARQQARANAVAELFGSPTVRERRLVEEAAVMGYVQGTMRPKDEEIPLNRVILASVLNACRHQSDLYPTLSHLGKAKTCEQCGRVGTRGFRTQEPGQGFKPLTTCSNVPACQRRWPKPKRDDD